MSHFLAVRKYEILLFSFLLLIFGDTFGHNLVLMVGNILQNMLAGLVIYYNRKSMRIIISVLIITTVIFIFRPFGIATGDVRHIQGIVYLVYFFMIAKEVFKAVVYADKVSKEMLSAALCGFVLLCLIGTFLFMQVELLNPGSFSNFGENSSQLKNLNYFSFVTMLTIGYGDILPVSLMARRAVMLMGLCGHFYTVFVTSILIGKFLSRQTSEIS